MGKPWEPEFFPSWLWEFMTNMGLLAAVVASFTLAAWTGTWLWNHGPKLLIKYGTKWMARLGIRWGNKRDLKKNGVPDEPTD